MPNIPSRLKAVREAAGLTQDELARKIGSGRVSISRWETGQIEPSRHVLASIGYATGYSPEWLLTGLGPKRHEGAAETSIPYRAEALDAELLAGILEVIQEYLAPRKRWIPPKVYASVVLTLYQTLAQEIQRAPAAPGELHSRILPFIRVALAGLG